MRIPLKIALLVSVTAALVTQAAAQTDIYLSAGDAECHFRTDERGVELHGSITGALRANGAFIETGGCGGDSNAGDPPPLPTIDLNVPSSHSVGSTSPLAISWQAYADKCTYELPSGWVADPALACNSTSQCLNGTAAVTIPSGTPLGTYEIGLNCTRLGGPGSFASSTRDVALTSAPPPPSCPPPIAPRQTVGTVFFWSVPNASEPNVNLEHWGNVFGRTKSDPTPRDWPQRNNHSRTFYAAKGHYIALKFTVPVVNPPAQGMMQFADSGMSPNLQNGKLSYSKCPGDFGQSGSDLESACLYNDRSFGYGVLLWKTADSGVTGNHCELQRGQTYYLNMLSNCEATECRYTLLTADYGPSSAGEILGIQVLLDLADLGGDD